MPLQLWINGGGGHFFVDTDLGGVQVGQTWQELDGSWSVEVNAKSFRATDLESAKRLFVERHDRSQVQLSPASASGKIDETGFETIDL
jgi:hypothetical protein